MKPPEFNVNAKITFEVAGRVYIVDVNEYGEAIVSCQEGPYTGWRCVVRPGETLRQLRIELNAPAYDDTWINRLDAAIAECRVMVDAGHVPPPYVPPCTCPATSEYDPPCPRHGIVGIGVTPR
jgi:hypothetical protein